MRIIVDGLGSVINGKVVFLFLLLRPVEKKVTSWEKQLLILSQKAHCQIVKIQ
jgi:hypothetical protein